MADFEAWLVFLILVVNVVGELQRKRTLAASRGFLAAARLSCFNQPQDLRPPSADRRETLPHDQYQRRFYNASPKFGGPTNKKFWGQKHAKFGPILHNFRL